MSLIRIKDKYQITIPLELRERLGLNLGAFLEISIENGKLILSPKELVDRAREYLSSDPSEAS
jgi:AbrB family looped-hinge helix DNA binding protein